MNWAIEIKNVERKIKTPLPLPFHFQSFSSHIYIYIYTQLIYTYRIYNNLLFFRVYRPQPCSASDATQAGCHHPSFGSITRMLTMNNSIIYSRISMTRKRKIFSFFLFVSKVQPIYLPSKSSQALASQESRSQWIQYLPPPTQLLLWKCMLLIYFNFQPLTILQRIFDLECFCFLSWHLLPNLLPIRIERKPAEKAATENVSYSCRVWIKNRPKGRCSEMGRKTITKTKTISGHKKEEWCSYQEKWVSLNKTGQTAKSPRNSKAPTRNKSRFCLFQRGR